MFRNLIRTTLLALALVPLGLLFPVLFLIVKQPDARVAIFFLAPFSCAVYVLLYSQWSSIRVWQKAGRLHQWRDDHGGIACTVARSTGWMVFGLVGSFAAEFAFIFTYRSAPFGMLALATYCPLFFCWCWRRTGHV